VGDQVADRAAASAERAISFGPFRLLPTQRLLLEGDKALRLGSRALDILITLVEHPGELVGKDEIVARVWPNMVVEESNLKVHVSALRRAIGDGSGGKRYLVTVPGRGYSFVALVTVERVGATPRQAVPPTRAHNLPALLTRLIGRDELVQNLVRQLPRLRFVTITGPGGIGKTSVALAIAEELITTYEDSVWLVDLSPIGDDRPVPSALAAVLGLEIRSDDRLPGLTSALRDRHMLIVLDNCEHVLDGVAQLVAGVLRSAPRVHVLATSREPLRVEGEHVRRLLSLESPPASARLDAAAARAFPAVQLLIERATASMDEFELDDADLPIVAEICRRLDGIPLAIELAPVRVGALGVRGLASGLDDRLRFLNRGRRAALGRHQTMRAAIDWSYGLLDGLEQKILRRLAIFAGGLTLDAAGAVVADADTVAGEITDQVLGLVAKSLVVADVRSAPPRYRLLEITRDYALEKLTEGGEFATIARRHAEHYRNQFQTAGATPDKAAADSRNAGFAPEIDNLRAALKWAFSPGGDILTGVLLAAAAVPVWVQLSLMPECRRYVGQALAGIDAGASPGTRIEMRLHAALGAALTYTTGPVPETVAAWSKTLRLALDLDDTDYQLQALRGLWAYRMNRSEYRAALELAEEFCRLAAHQDKPLIARVGDRMAALILHYLGEQADARKRIDWIAGGPVDVGELPPPTRFLLNQRVAADALLARILWLQGFPDQAVRTAQSAVQQAQAADHTISICHALAQAACPVASWTGDLAGTDRLVTMLLDRATQHALEGWIARGRCFSFMLLIERGDTTAGSAGLRSALDGLHAAGSMAEYPAFLATLAMGLGLAGRMAEAQTAIDKAITRADSTEERWCAAELLRIRGELLLMSNPAEKTAAEDQFRRSLDLAHRQGALSWELRAATSLAHLQRDQGRRHEARDSLAAVYDRFSEGFNTVDLKTARRVVDAPI
jgi:predicted ATPase